MNNSALEKSRLIVHMDDRSTDFLSAIYQGVEGTLITGIVSPDHLNDLIDAHDQIIMLGHGCGGGLFSLGGGLIISSAQVPALSKKTDSIFIWCHASTFVKTHNLKGFSTGMFVSEVGEAFMFQLDPDSKKIEQSNNFFAELVGKHLNEDIHTLYTQVKAEYRLPDNPVCDYNRNLLTLF